MKKTKSHLTREMSAQWAQKAQLYVLDSLMAESPWSAEQMAFHGGTSLHFSWRSPRFSEDLDFLIDRQVRDIEQVMKRVERKVNERFMAEDANFKVEVKDKTKHPDRMPAFQVCVEHAQYFGKCMVKTEFWRVEGEYLQKYPSTFRTPITPGEIVSRVVHPVPAAELSTAFCDKLTAFATRPYLKWRDIYDLWWIGTQTDTCVDPLHLVEQFKHNLSAYSTPEGLSISEALRRFSSMRSEELVSKADPDLRKWVPTDVWNHLKNAGVIEVMVEYMKTTLEQMATLVDTPQVSLSSRRKMP